MPPRISKRSFIRMLGIFQSKLYLLEQKIQPFIGKLNENQQL